MEYVVLLRAVNLGKRNQVNMGVLRALLAENGYRDVESILNSGNVLLRSEKTPLEIKQRIALLISERFNVEIEVFVLRKDDLLKSIDSYPFEPLNENQVAYVCILDKEINLHLPFTLKHIDLKHQDGPIVFCVGNLGEGHTSFPNDLIEKKYSAKCTSRNLQTIHRILKA